jgi:asparagine synthase (glutamine-hydrolysing)
MKAGITKIILREGLKDVLPENIRNRKDKIGFATPDTKLLRTEKGKKFAWDIITSESFKKRGYWDSEKVRQMLEEHVKKKRDNSAVLWKMIILELWFRMWIDESLVRE